MKLRPAGAELFHVDGRTDMTKLIVASRNFVKAPKNEKHQLHVSTCLDHHQLHVSTYVDHQLRVSTRLDHHQVHVSTCLDHHQLHVSACLDHQQLPQQEVD